MRILHVIHSGAVGGGPKVVLELATHVPGDHTIASADDGPLLMDARRLGINTRTLHYTGEYSFSLSIPPLLRCLRDFDLVHLHGQFAAFYGAIAATISRFHPVVYTAHFPSFVTDSGWKNRKRNHIAELVPSRVSEIVVACSETSRSEYLARGLLKENKIRTIYNGVDIQKPTRSGPAMRLDLEIGDNDPVVLAMGRFTDQKGFDVLLNAMPMVLERLPRVKLVLVGDGERRTELESETKSLGIEQAVRFTGFSTDTRDLLNAATVVAVPSRYDVFPLVPLEAMMAEKAVVVSDLPALREAVEDGVTGLVSPLRPQPLAARLIELISDSSLRDRVAQQAAVRARERFSVERMAGQYEQLYRDVVGQSH